MASIVAQYFSCCLKHQHPIWVLLHSLANSLGKAVEHNLATWVSATHMGDRKEAPGFNLGQFWPFLPFRE